MSDALELLAAEIAAFLRVADKREHLIEAAEKLFDQVVEPIDLPGPDRLVDPVLRAAIRPLVGRLYDAIVAKLGEPPRAA